MRSAALGSFLAAVLACGPIDQAGSPSIVAADGGPVAAADAGAPLPVPVPDAGGPPAGGGPTGGPPAAAGDCDGVLPSQAGRGHAETIPHASGQACWYFTSDLSGNVAAEAHSGDASGTGWTGTWHVWAAGGGHLGTFPAGGDVYGQVEGFQSIHREAGGSSLVQWTVDGKSARSTLVDRGGCRAQTFQSVPGGSLVLDPCPGSLTAWRFDAQGAPVASAQISSATNAAGVTDGLGRTLIVVWPGSAAGLSATYAARWYDDKLAPLTPFFAAPDGGSGTLILRPLNGGGAALQIGGAWVATSQSGHGSFDAAPDWLVSHRNYDLGIVRGGRAYAFIPKSGVPSRNTVDVVAASGTRCGAITFPVQGLSMGPEGTIIGSSGEGGCTATWWSALLR